MSIILSHGLGNVESMSIVCGFLFIILDWSGKDINNPLAAKKFYENSCLILNFLSSLFKIFCRRTQYMPVSKKKVIKSLDSLSDELKDLMKVQYPTGYEN